MIIVQKLSRLIYYYYEYKKNWNENNEEKTVEHGTTFSSLV